MAAGGGGLLMMEEAVYVWDQGVYGKSLYLLFSIVVNLKLLLKIN